MRICLLLIDITGRIGRQSWYGALYSKRIFTSSSNKRHTLYLHEVADDRDVGEQIVASAAAATVPAVVGQARDGQTPSGTSW